MSVFHSGSLLYAEAVEEQTNKDMIRATRSTIEHAEESPKIIISDKRIPMKPVSIGVRNFIPVTAAPETPTMVMLPVEAPPFERSMPSH